ncbi:MAG: leucine-rich repeat domain-containing protein [Gammaproteobacteria bacterium]|nr:leucine-rich repeat domain-containing protein [Gammaproteobacteria bacterium]
MTGSIRARPRRRDSHAMRGWRGRSPFPAGARAWTSVAMLVLCACGDATGPTLSPGERCGSDSSAVPNFADPALEAGVRAALDLAPEESLTCGRAASLESLGVNATGIRDLSGVENLTGLTELLVAQNAIEDLGPLAALTDLEYLDVRENSITDLSPLAGLTSMFALSFGENQVSDLSPVRNMSQLEQLGGSHNRISDLTPLAGLETLLRLELYNNDIADLDPIIGLWALQTLDVGRNTLSDLSALTELDNLLIIGLERTTITDVSPLIDMIYLTTLHLQDNRELSDIQPLLDNPGVGRDDEVKLERTAVSCEDIEMLRAKRATVTSNCP